ncbi:ATP-dependent helicase [Bacillus sp. BGMRC 2118]|nr:ATP-dependent helicase [Bacillus sp. BGMRC 2118]
MEKILSILNQEQYNAVTSKANYLQIAAGPGTGKTSTLAARIFYKQLEEDLQQNEMLAISFSKSAKYQLIKKMNEYTNIMGYGSVIEILTFHSLAHRIIRYGIFTGESKYRQGFKVIETEDFVLVKEDIIKGLCVEYADRDLIRKALSQTLNLLRQGSHLENDFLTHWSQIEVNTLYKVNIDATTRINVSGKDIIEFWKRVERLSLIRNEIDYQGLISEALKLITLKENTYRLVTEDLKHIFVDEYQDTSLSQEKLLVSLADYSRDITVVGDENQTIYTFNGSNVENMKRYFGIFSRLNNKLTDRVELTQNYRSTNRIIELSNHFLNKELITQPRYKSNSDVEEFPIIINTQSLELASAYIAKEIQRLNKSYNVSLNDICVLYRKNTEHSPQLNSLKIELDSLGIPYNETATLKDGLDIKKEVLAIYEEYPDYNLDELVPLLEAKGTNDSIVTYIKETMSSGALYTDDLIDFIVEIDGITEGEQAESKVTLRTVHSAKGQEFPIVFIMYIGDKQFPHGSNPDIAEEKRLFYVGITRAKERLYILGKHGVRFEDFLGKCKTANSSYLHYNSRVENENIEGYGLKENDKKIIRETTRKQEHEFEQHKARIAKYMEEW